MSSATEATAHGTIARQGPPAQAHATIVRQKPLMDMRQILLMNLGFFGIQYSFGMQQTAVNPIYNYLGANPNTVHFRILMAAAKSIQVVGWGTRGRSL
jgi:maltose/moltooligosaccharide transporter